MIFVGSASDRRPRCLEDKNRSRMAGSIPKKRTVAKPGFVSIAPGKGVTTINPVSVFL